MNYLVFSFGVLIGVSIGVLGFGLLLMAARPRRSTTYTDLPQRNELDAASLD